MDAESAAGWTLVAGFVVFLTGAVRWRVEYEGPPDTALPLIHADRRRRAWIHSWMVAGLFVTPAGLAAYAASSEPATARATAWAAAMVYAVGAASFVVSLAFRLTVGPWAAERTVVDGAPPDVFGALDAWAGALYLVHMFSAYAASAVLGGAVIADDSLPSWVGWLGVGWGLLSVLVLSSGGRWRYVVQPPILAHTFTAAVGVALLLG